MLLRRFGDRSPRGGKRLPPSSGGRDTPDDTSLREGGFGPPKAAAPTTGTERPRRARCLHRAVTPCADFSLFPFPSSFFRQGGLSGKRPLSLPGGRQLPLTGEPKRNGLAGHPLSHGACVRRAATAPLAQGSLRGKRIGKSRIFPQKSVDPGIWLCYTLFYLSDERFLFVRFFPRAGRSPAFQTGRQCSQIVSK